MSEGPADDASERSFSSQGRRSSAFADGPAQDSESYEHHLQIAATMSAVSQLPPDELVTMLAKQQLAAQKRLVEMADRLQATVKEFERRSGPQQLATVEGQVNAAMKEVRDLYEGQLEQVRAAAERREAQLNKRWGEAVKYAEVQLSEKAQLAGELHDRVSAAESRAAAAENSSAGIRNDCEALVVRIKELHKALLEGTSANSGEGLCTLCRDKIVRDEVAVQSKFPNAGRGSPPNDDAAQRPGTAGRWRSSGHTGLLVFETPVHARQPSGKNRLSMPGFAPGRDHLMYDARRAARGEEPFLDKLDVAPAASWPGSARRPASARQGPVNPPQVQCGAAPVTPRPPSAKRK